MPRRLTRFLPLAGLVVAIPAVWILVRFARDIDVRDVLAELQQFSTTQVLAAVACSLIAFVLNGIYEARALREIGHPHGVLRPMLIAGIVYPISHSVSLSTLSGAALRYRLYAPLGLSHTTIGGLVLLTVLPYVLGLGLLIDLALVFGAQDVASHLHIGVEVVLVLGIIGLGKDVGYAIFTAVRKRPITIGRFSFRLPSFRFTLFQFLVGSIEIIFVALVLYIFLPKVPNLTVAAFMVAYLLSVFVGNMSNVPLGLGVFEAGLLLMLDEIPTEQLIAAVLAYRVVFELLQLVLALGLLGLYEFISRHGLAGRFWRKRFTAEEH